MFNQKQIIDLIIKKLKNKSMDIELIVNYPSISFIVFKNLIFLEDLLVDLLFDLQKF